MRKALALAFFWLINCVAAYCETTSHLSVLSPQFSVERPVPVILTAGQSNADGRVPLAELPKYIHYDYCLWSYGSGDFMTATGQFTPFSPHVAKPGIEQSWGFDAMVYYLLEQCWQQPFYVIKQTMGGTAIDASCTNSTHGWLWNVGAKEKSLTRAFCQQIDDCLAQLPKNYDIRCLLWHQGESDQPAADRYHDNLKAVIGHIRQHLVDKTGRKEYASLPVVCATFAKGSRQGSPKVAAALRQLEREDSHFHVVDASDLSLQKDGLHFDARGAETLGWRVFERMRETGIADNCCQRGEDAFKGIWPVTDPAKRKSLNGEWQLAVNGKEGTVGVPGCWERLTTDISTGKADRFSQPKYDYPDSLTGVYRTAFTVPADWKGQQVVIRLDGVLRGYELLLNGQSVGSWESAYNTCLFDLTPYLTKKAFKGEPQQLTLRVYSHFKGYEFDCFDDWATMGIFRDVTLMAVPKTHLSDLTVTTRMDGTVTVCPTIANATRHTTVSYELADAEGRIVSTGDRVKNPHLWTAETPYLYTLRLSVKERGKTLQTFTHRIGIREISIAGNVLKVNGQPVKLRGVNAHSTDPLTVKVISDDLTLKDMLLMKEASVNFLRLSHYPREPRFYELADSLGFYLVDEVPFGYGDKHLSDSCYRTMLMTRARATIQRDKLHPSVIVWSVGNENPLTSYCVEVGNYVGALDPSRPYCFPQVGSYFRRFWENGGTFPSAAPVYAPHYPTTGQIAGFYQHLDRPVVFTEYCHTLGTSFEDHDRQWEIIERTPGIAGGAVWEWADQGMPIMAGEKPATSDAPSDYGYEERVLYAAVPQQHTPTPALAHRQPDIDGFEMFGNKGTDGLLYADRTPLPNYFELQHNYAQAAATDSIITTDSPTLTLHIRNRFDFLDLQGNVSFRWTYTEDRDTLAQGTFSPSCQPHANTTHTLQLPNAPQAERICLLSLEVSDRNGRIFNRQSIPVNPRDITQRLLAGLTIATDDPMSLVQDGLLVRAGRKATLAETLKVADKRLPRYLLRLPTNNNHPTTITPEISTTKEGNATHIAFTLTADTTDTFLSELGVAMLLDKRIDRVQWIGNGVMPTYPGRFRAGRYSFWALSKGDLYFEGNRRDVDAAWLSDADGNGILMVCRKANVSFEQTDRGIVLTCNAAVAGLGPKFARTAFPVVAKQVGTVSGDFYLYRTSAGQLPQLLRELFVNPATVQPAFRPFRTQYDTYLMRYDDIVDN